MIHTQKGLIRQFTSGFLVSLSTLIFGFAFSWISITETILRSRASPVGPLSDDQISWLGSLPASGAFFGALFWGRFINKIGRKKAAILTTVPILISQGMYIFAHNYYILFMARFLSGTGVIGAMLNTPGYIAEICETKIKSNVASLFIVVINMGIVIIFIAGFFFTYFYLNIVITIIPILIAMLIFFLVPESPVHLIKVGQDEKAKEQLKWLRASHDTNYIDTEFNKLKDSFLNASECTKSLTYSEIWHSSYYLKSLLIGLVLQSSISMSGVGLVTTYVHNIVSRALNLNEASHRAEIGRYAMFISGSQLLGSVIAFFIFHKLNRKVFVVGCNFTSTMCFMFIATALYFRSADIFHIPPILFIPAFCVYMLAQGIGLGNVVYVTTPELFSAECRNTFSAALLFLHFSLHFILCKLYPVLVGTIHLYGWLFICGSYSLWISIFGYFILPETKGKSIQQVFNKLSKNKTHDRGYAKTHTSQVNTIA